MNFRVCVCVCINFIIHNNKVCHMVSYRHYENTISPVRSMLKYFFGSGEYWCKYISLQNYKCMTELLLSRASLLIR